VRGSSAPRHASPAFSRRHGSTWQGQGLRPFPLHPFPCAASGNGNHAGFRTFQPVCACSVRLMGLVPMRTNVQPRSAANRSGSERRKRTAPVSVRFLPDERMAVEEKAREVGLSLASFLRACGLGTPGPRARRSPPVNAEALARATAALNRVGSNLNQIAHVLNAGGSIGIAQDCRSTLSLIREAAAAIREVVGRKDRP
jgi:hypothetical protein